MSISGATNYPVSSSSYEADVFDEVDLPKALKNYKSSRNQAIGAAVIGVALAIIGAISLALLAKQIIPGSPLSSSIFIRLSALSVGFGLVVLVYGFSVWVNEARDARNQIEHYTKDFPGYLKNFEESSSEKEMQGLTSQEIEEN